MNDMPVNILYNKLIVLKVSLRSYEGIRQTDRQTDRQTTTIPSGTLCAEGKNATKRKIPSGVVTTGRNNDIVKEDWW